MAPVRSTKGFHSSVHVRMGFIFDEAVDFLKHLTKALGSYEGKANLFGACIVTDSLRERFCRAVASLHLLPQECREDLIATLPYA